MMTIYKYPLRIDDKQSVNMHEHAEILCVHMQASKITLWAKVDLDEIIVGKDIYIRGTGHDFTGEEKRYIGTAFDGPFVWHVYE